MKERPILFSAPMVRALLDGSKTQTRRIAPIKSMDIKPLEFASKPGVSWAVAFTKPMGPSRSIASYSGAPVSEAQARSIIASQFCPYGYPGDRLWVKETTVKVEDHGYEGPVFAESDDGRNVIEYGLSPGEDDVTEIEPEEIKLRPSIFMKRSMSRITLEITAVRVERLQDISESDAMDEGLEQPTRVGIDGRNFWRDYRHSGYGSSCLATAVDSYKTLWESINNHGSWDLNPWVWVIEFKRLPS